MLDDFHQKRAVEAALPFGQIYAVVRSEEAILAIESIA